MAHFAKLDDNNIVIDVCVVNNEDIQNLEFPDSESVGIGFLTNWSQGYSNWKQTSYNKKFRKNYAAIGGYYDPSLDAFIPPKPFNSWVLNSDLYWEAPFPEPDQEKAYMYYWDEPTVSWVIFSTTE